MLDTSVAILELKIIQECRENKDSDFLKKRKV